jgi:glycerol uptake facilitator-like aquaporin
MVAEAVGTFFLVLIGPGTVVVDAFSDGTVGLVGIAPAFGFVVSAVASVRRPHQSGGHAGVLVGPQIPARRGAALESRRSS